MSTLPFSKDELSVNIKSTSTVGILRLLRRIPMHFSTSTYVETWNVVQDTLNKKAVFCDGSILEFNNNIQARV